MGGFATWNLVEDLTTSYNMHAAGWKSLYYQYPLSVGLSPMNVWGVYRQRGQWALDTLRLFFWDNPLFKRGLDAFGRTSYLIIALAYLCAAFVFPFFFVVPIWSYLTGGNVLYRHELEFAAYRGLYFVCMALAMHYLFRGRQAGKQFQVLTGLFPVYARAAVLALLYPSRRQRAYRPNNESGPRRVPPALAGGVAAAGPAGGERRAALLRHHGRPRTRAAHRRQHRDLGAGDLEPAARGAGRAARAARASRRGATRSGGRPCVNGSSRARCWWPRGWSSPSGSCGSGCRASGDRRTNATRKRGVSQAAGRPQDASAEMAMAIVEDPANAGYLVSQGYLQLRLDRPREAEQSFREALKHGPHAEATLGLARALRGAPG